MATTPNLAQAKRDAKRTVSEPPVVTVSLSIPQWRKLLGKMSGRTFASKLPARGDGKHWSASHISNVESGIRGVSEELREAILQLIIDELQAS
jgi:hypothetical protein